MLLENISNPVYSDEQVTMNNLGFLQDFILSASTDHLYALTDEQVFVMSSFQTCVLYSV